MTTQLETFVGNPITLGNASIVVTWQIEAACIEVPTEKAKPWIGPTAGSTARPRKGPVVGSVQARPISLTVTTESQVFDLPIADGPGVAGG